jgi:hypothetical protein
MRGILADINVEGIMAHLARIWLSAAWSGIWFGLGISIESFESLALRSDSADTVIWEAWATPADHFGWSASSDPSVPDGILRRKGGSGPRCHLENHVRTRPVEN